MHDFRRPNPFGPTLLMMGALVWPLLRVAAGDPLPKRLNLDLGLSALTGLNITAAISPDGSEIVFHERGRDGKAWLAIRALDQPGVRLLPGTEDGSDPFFAPDGKWVGFFADGQLQKTSIRDGGVVALGVRSSVSYGASWADDGSIIAALGNFNSLSQIDANGGRTRALTRLSPGEVTHRWPQVLPGGNAVLFTASSSPDTMEGANIEVVSRKTGDVKVLVRGGYFGRYLPSGQLAYVHEGVLFAVKFDPERLETRGPATPVLDDLAANPITGGGQFDVSKTGTLVYASRGAVRIGWRMDWLDASGRLLPLIPKLGIYTAPRLSPDGRNLAFIGEGSAIYLYNLKRHAVRRLGFTDPGAIPTWTRDGRYLVYQSDTTAFNLVWMRSAGASLPLRLLTSAYDVIPWSFTPGIGRLAYFQASPHTGFDIWTLPLAFANSDFANPDRPHPGTPELFVRTEADEMFPQFSPDGQWIAYCSNESGRDEIYVRPFPKERGGKWQISRGGGIYAFWSAVESKLFYESADNQIWTVNYTVTRNSFTAGEPRLWSNRRLFNIGALNLDMAPDGQRFIVLTTSEGPAGATGSVHVWVLPKFIDELRRRIP